MNTQIINKEHPNFDILLCKQQLNILDDDFTEDSFLKTKYIQAVASVEGYLGKDVAYTTKRITTENFNSDNITIDDHNYISIDSISGDTLITGYTTTESYGSFKISFSSEIDVDQLVVTYKTGYEKGKLPEGINSGILLKFTDLYSNRGTYTLSSYKETGAFEMTLNPYKSLR